MQAVLWYVFDRDQSYSLKPYVSYSFQCSLPDLEYCKLSNDKITAGESETFMTEFIDELCSQFVQTYNITLTRECIVDLDSSTDKKFSRHLIVHLPHDELFKDAHAAGVFAKQFVSRLADELAAGTLEKRQPILAQCLFVKTKDPTKTTCFVDLGVYTKNRLFRILGSSKFGKRPDAALRIASANKFRFPDEFDNSNFYMVESAPISQVRLCFYVCTSSDLTASINELTG